MNEVKVATAAFVRNYNIDPQAIKQKEVQNEKELNDYALSVTASPIIQIIAKHDSYESNLLGMTVQSIVPSKIVSATQQEAQAQTPTERGVAPTEKHLPDRPIGAETGEKEGLGEFGFLIYLGMGIIGIALVGGIVLMFIKKKKGTHKKKDVLTKI